MKTTKEVNENGKVYLKESWIKEPRWNDVVKQKSNAYNNSELIEEMQAKLRRFI
ncbi:hypothetical protein UT300007_14200 [Clostridium sp. CTA-7]